MYVHMYTKLFRRWALFVDAEIAEFLTKFLKIRNCHPDNTCKLSVEEIYTYVWPKKCLFQIVT